MVETSEIECCGEKIRKSAGVRPGLWARAASKASCAPRVAMTASHASEGYPADCSVETWRFTSASRATFSARSRKRPNQ